MNSDMHTYFINKQTDDLGNMPEQALHCSRAVKYPLRMMVKRNRTNERGKDLYREHMFG